VAMSSLRRRRRPGRAPVLRGRSVSGSAAFRRPPRSQAPLLPSYPQKARWRVTSTGSALDAVVSSASLCPCCSTPLLANQRGTVSWGSRLGRAGASAQHPAVRWRDVKQGAQTRTHLGGSWARPARRISAHACVLSAALGILPGHRRQLRRLSRQHRHRNAHHGWRRPHVRRHGSCRPPGWEVDQGRECRALHHPLAGLARRLAVRLLESRPTLLGALSIIKCTWVRLPESGQTWLASFRSPGCYGGGDRTQGGPGRASQVARRVGLRQPIGASAGA
jgi:hypothetical protein